MCVTAAVPADIDADGDSDLLLVQDLGNSRVFENRTSSNGSLKFADITEPEVIADERGHGLAVADYDNDGDMDWFVTGVSAQDAKGYRDLLGNRLYRNEGDGTFKDVSESAGISDGSDFTLDLGFVSAPAAALLYPGVALVEVYDTEGGTP